MSKSNDRSTVIGYWSTAVIVTILCLVLFINCIYRATPFGNWKVPEPNIRHEIVATGEIAGWSVEDGAVHLELTSGKSVSCTFGGVGFRTSNQPQATVYHIWPYNGGPEMSWDHVQMNIALPRSELMELWRAMRKN